jgi:hypothetical protein
MLETLDLEDLTAIAETLPGPHALGAWHGQISSSAKPAA